MKHLESREYKLMLRTERFAKEGAARAFREELALRAGEADVALEREFQAQPERRILFLDLPGDRLHRNEWLLRRRETDGHVEYTLKFRSGDRYLAAAADVSAARGLADDPKFEEDVAAPFWSRFSHSNTVEFPADEARTTWNSLDEAARVFPGLARVRKKLALGDGAPLSVVRGFVAREQVLKKARLRIGEAKIDVALILWRSGDDPHPAVVEFSYRWEAERERYCPKVARRLKRLFHELQASDWCAPKSRTKTQFAYGEHGWAEGD